MKKNYFSAFKKSVGFFPVIILGFALAIVSYLSYNDSIFQFVKESDSVIGFAIKNIALAAYIALAVAGLIGLKTSKVGLIDAFRLSNILGVGLGYGLMFLTQKFPNDYELYVIFGAGGLSLLEVLIRLIGKKEVNDRVGINGYVGALANSFNPICSALIALGLFVAFYYFRNNAYVIEYVSKFGVIAAIIIFIITIAISINKTSTYANFIDELLFILFIALTLVLTYALIDNKTVVGNLLVVYGSLIASLLFRGFTFTGNYKSSKLKANRYFAQVYSCHSILIAFIVASCLALFFAYTTYNKNTFPYLLNLFKLDNFLNVANMDMIASIVLMSILVLNCLLLVILKNLKSPEIEKVDAVVSINSHIVIYCIPLAIFVYKNINNLFDPIIPFIALCVFAVFAIVAGITQIMRLKNYQGIMIEDMLAATIKANEEAKAQQAQAEQEDEQPQEEVQEEVQEEAQPAEEVVEEVVEGEPTEEVVEEVVEEPQVEEEVIYVDEDGNEIEAPVEGEEVEEEIIYVDEDGNEISAEEAEALGAEFVEEEQPEEVVEEEPTEEVVEEVVEEEPTEEVVEGEPEEYEEVVEEYEVDPNADVEVVVEVPDDEEEEEDEAEAEDEEDSEDADALEETEEAQEEVQEEAKPEEPKMSSVLVNDFEVLDAEGKPKKIRTKFNSKLMYALPETKDYYSEIKNYLVMYRAKGRYSSRCETFRYKGLIAKVALGGKAVKVFLAIDPSSLEGSKYHYRDMSAKKQYVEVPTMIKVRSPRGLKYFKELVDLLMAARGVKPKRGFEPTDYTADLIPNGEAILGKLGLSRDVMGKPMTVSSLPDGIPDNIEDYIPAIQGEPLEEEEVRATVYLDTLCAHFVEGEEVTIDVLKSLHIVREGNVIHVKARGAMDRSLKIFAEYFDADALKVLMATNSTAVKIFHDNEEVVEEEVTE